MKTSFLMAPMILLVLSVPPVSGESGPTERAHPRVVIFYQDTEWKQLLLRQLTRGLKDLQIDVTADLLDNCPSYSLDDWDAVVLMSNVRGVQSPSCRPGFHQEEPLLPQNRLPVDLRQFQQSLRAVWIVPRPHENRRHHFGVVR